MKKKKPVQKPKPNIHDEFVKAVFAHISLVIAFLRQYVDSKLLDQLDLNRIKPEPTMFPGEEGHSRIADMVFSIPVKKKYRGKYLYCLTYSLRSRRRGGRTLHE